ncbi:MAG TPA: hypothetical protein VHI13_14275 [Candidatus Kapabacteria bacterium]|nr:hypothetical protein [Candidatus Kapabacteria bacterium]
MTRPRLLLVLMSALFGAAGAHAQEPTRAQLDSGLAAHVVVIAREGRDSIVLRWGVTKPAVWLIGNRGGYAVDRAIARSDGRPPAAGAFTQIAIVKPWSPDQFERAAAAGDTASRFATLAAALLDTAEGDHPDAPLDGSPDAVREGRNRLAMRHGFALLAADRSASAAEGLGLRYVDRTVHASERYVYRVRMIAESPIYPVDSGYTTAAAKPYVRAERRNRVRAAEYDGSILVNWPADAYYSGYVVERSADKGRTFERLTTVPLVSAHSQAAADSVPEAYLDTAIAANYRPYTYRVYGATPFADEELLGDVTAMGRDRTPPGRPHVPNPEPVDRRHVKIVWTMDEPPARDLAGFMVLRDSTDAGPFQPLWSRLLSPTARSFVDTSFSESVPNYYAVAAFDTAGNFSLSFPALVTLIDSTPPDAPGWVRGTMDTNGVVTLVLHASREADCMGYRILRSNAEDHEFSSIIESYGTESSGAARDTVLHDTVEVGTLTRYVYYRAIALDRHFNESVPSVILAVPRPDRIPPSPPVIVDVTANESGVGIEFVPSTSEDVKSHTVLRRVSGEERWDTVKLLPRDARSYTDTTTERGTRYDYSIFATDSANLRSERAAAVTARAVDPGTCAPVNAFEVRYDTSARQARLSWTYAASGAGYRFLVYRSAAGGSLRQIAALPSDARAYADAEARSAGTYEYIVKVVTRSGAESQPSDRRNVVVGSR